MSEEGRKKKENILNTEIAGRGLKSSALEVLNLLVLRFKNDYV